MGRNYQREASGNVTCDILSVKRSPKEGMANYPGFYIGSFGVRARSKGKRFDGSR